MRKPEITVSRQGCFVVRFNDGSRSFRTSSRRAAVQAVSDFLTLGVVTL